MLFEPKLRKLDNGPTSRTLLAEQIRCAAQQMEKNIKAMEV